MSRGMHVYTCVCVPLLNLSSFVKATGSPGHSQWHGLVPPAGSWSHGAWGLGAGLAVSLEPDSGPSSRHHLTFLLSRMWVVVRLEWYLTAAQRRSKCQAPVFPAPRCVVHEFSS